MNAFERAAGGPISACGLDVLQVNVGLACDLACRHCHLKAGPARRERMDRPTMEKVVRQAALARPRLVDITGGAPELNPELPWLLMTLKSIGINVKVRTNLTAMLRPGNEHYFDLFSDLDVTLTASMPCYLEENVDALRGKGVFKLCIEALRRLNAKGYARPGGPELELVFNPSIAPALPPGQACLEPGYRKELGEKYGVTFTRLLAIANMPLGRFQEALAASGQDLAYLELLRQRFNPMTLPGLMCKTQVSVGPGGNLYDCDFNLALGLTINHGAPSHIDAFDADALSRRVIVTGEHCLGCTAGAGSSCSGAIG